MGNVLSGVDILGRAIRNTALEAAFDPVADWAASHTGAGRAVIPGIEPLKRIRLGW